MVSVESDRSRPLPHLPAYASRGRDRTAASDAPAASDRSRTCPFAGVVQSSRLAPFGPRDRCLASAILEIAAGWALGKTHCFKVSPPRKSALQAPTLGLRDDGKSNLQFFPFYFSLSSAPLALSLSPPF